MEIVWKVNAFDLNKVKSIVANQQNNYFVKSRVLRNIDNPPKRVTKKTVWYWMVACLLTTQQRSGPNTPVNRFIHLKPFPLFLKFQLCALKV